MADKAKESKKNAANDSKCTKCSCSSCAISLILLVFIIVVTFLEITNSPYKIGLLTANSSGNSNQDLQASVNQLNDKVDDLIKRIAIAPDTPVSGLKSEKKFDEKAYKLAEKYHIILLTNEIIERIGKGKDYSEEIKAVKVFLDDKFQAQITVLEGNLKAPLPSKEKILEDLSSVKYVVEDSEEKEDKGYIEKIKESAKNLVKVRKSQDVEAKTVFEASIAKAQENLKEDDYRQALSVLSELDQKSDNLNKVMEDIGAWIKLKESAEQIIKGTLKDD